MAPTLPKKRFLDTSNAILIKGCQQKDILSQQQLYKLYYPDMIKICHRYAKDADEAGLIYNNAMLRVFKGIGSYAEEGRLTGWIKTIVIHSCIDFSKRKNIFNNAVSVIKEEEAVIFPEVLDSLSGKDIQKLIAELPGATATVFNLYIYEGFTHKQIGEQLGISDGTSKWHVSEAKKILRNKLERSFKTELRVNAAG